MKIIQARSIGEMQVYDLSVDHSDHSFLHSSGVVAHNCAFVFMNDPVGDLIPLTTVGGFRVTSFTAPDVEAMGGIKYDFLVINSLNDIQDCIRLVQQRSGRTVPKETRLNGKRVPGLRLVPHGDDWVDIWDLPSDQSVFADIANGDTKTVFQLDKPAALQGLRQFCFKKPNGNYIIDSIEAMSAFTALDRPGPLNMFVMNPDGGKDHNLLVEYSRRARGATPSPEVFSLFDELFPETYGVMTYQEQLQKLYQVVTGSTGAEAEEFRGNIAKKKMDKVLKVKPKFIKNVAERLGDEAKAMKLWEFLETWAEYGFNKSHAVCYMVIAYACAYLKHHYPLEWWTSVLSNATKDDINEQFWQHCGHLIDLPDVKLSTDRFEIQGDRIRAPISLLDGVGEKAHAQLCAGRPYTDIYDFCQRIEAFKDAGTTVDAAGKKTRGRSALNRGVIYKLIISGAMDSLFPGEMILESGEGVPLSVIDQLDMFEDALAKSSGKKKQPVDPRFSSVHQLTRYQMKKDVLPAFGLRGHLLDLMIQRRVSGIVDYGKSASWTHWKEEISFVGYDNLLRLNAISPFPNGGIKVAVAAYITETKTFQYGGSKEQHRPHNKEAAKWVFDIDGGRIELVKWGDRTTNKVDKRFKDIKAGSIVVAILNKYAEGRDFVVEDIDVIQQPLEAKTEQSA